MDRRSWLALVLIVGGLVAVGIALGRAVMTGQEVASVALSIPILVIAALTLWFTVPRPAKLRVERLDEADLSDLIFYVYPQPNPDNVQQQPVDYLLQLHVAVSNLGERKAILSSITINGFRTDRGEVVHLPDAPATIGGSQWLQQSGWVNSQLHFQNISIPPPYVLDRDDVIVIRFRGRRGIDWSARWNLELLQSFTAPLREKIVGAFGTITWRRAGQVLRENFDVAMKVEQQAEYVQLIDDLTQGLTLMPSLSPHPIPLE